MKRVLVRLAHAGESRLLMVWTQALRSRTMPSAIPRRDILSASTWRNSKALSQQRQASTAQGSLRHDEDPRASAVLHGRKGSMPHSQQPSNHDRPAEHPRLRADTSHPQKTQLPEIQPEGLGKTVNNSQEISTWHRRKRARDSDMPQNPRPSRRRRVEPTSTAVLKDAAYIRRTMHVPTQDDYPRLKSALFNKPKQRFHNDLQGFISLKTEYSSIGRDLFRCTLSCSFSQADPTEVTTGEGRNKVSSS